MSLLVILSLLSFSGFANEIYKTIDKDGNITFSSIAPPDSKILQTVSVKKLIKKISIIQGASAQNEKIKAITKKLSDSRIERIKKRQNLIKNYNDEITLIKNERLQDLKNLNNGKSESISNITSNEQIKDSIRRMIEQKKE